MDDRPKVPAPEASVRPAALPVGVVVGAALALGVAGDLLLRGSAGPGLNFFLLFAGLGGAVGALSRRAGLALSREARAILGVGIAFAATLVLRGSEPLRLLAFLAAAVAFALPALRAGAAWLRRSGVSDQVLAMTVAGANAAVGAFRLVGAALAGRSAPDTPSAGAGEPGEASRHPGWAALRGLLLALPFLLVFGALFMSADRIFADLVTDFVDLDYEEIASHLLVTAVLTWLACGYLTGFLTGTRPVGLPDGFGARAAVGIVEIGIALALVDLLFALFVGVQVRYLFGGSGLVEVTPGLTYAEYVRDGFEQLALAGALVLPSLLAADWLLHQRRRRDVVVFRVLGGLLLLLLVVIVASALQRVRAYQAAYGLTESRFYGAAFLGWLTVLTVWFAATVLRRRRDRFAFPALVSAFAFVALLVAANPDVRIARTNLERAGDPPTGADRSGEGVDVRYLASLGADAVPTLMAALPGLPPRPRCVLARGLLERWGPGEVAESDWRSWNWSVARARGMVGAETEALREMAEGADAEACPPGDR
jgi:ABC-type glycerol-3-phosphate transport system permease component